MSARETRMMQGMEMKEVAGATAGGQKVMTVVQKMMEEVQEMMEEVQEKMAVAQETMAVTQETMATIAETLQVVRISRSLKGRRSL